MAAYSAMSVFHFTSGKGWNVFSRSKSDDTDLERGVST